MNTSNEIKNNNNWTLKDFDTNKWNGHISCQPLKNDFDLSVSSNYLTVREWLPQQLTDEILKAILFSNIFMDETDKNNAFLEKYNLVDHSKLTKGDVYQLLKNLTEDDFVKADINYDKINRSQKFELKTSTEVVFIYKLCVPLINSKTERKRRIPVYVKFKIEKGRLILMSFHEAD